MSVTIPAAIAALPLSISEKIVLVLIDENPCAKNRALARSVGMTERGMKKLTKRLIAAGQVQQVRRGRARRLFLTFHMEQGTEFPDSENSARESHRELCSTKAPAVVAPRAISRAQLPLDEFLKQTMITIAEITFGQFFPETAVRLLEDLILRVQAEMPDGDPKREVLTGLMMRQGAFMAIAAGAGLPKAVQRAMDERIQLASREQLVEFRQRMSVARLVDKAPLALAAFVADHGRSWPEPTDGLDKIGSLPCCSGLNVLPDL